MQLDCPQCKKPIGIPEGAQGKKVACPLCATHFLVPSAAPELKAVALPPVEAPSSFRADPAPPPPPVPKPAPLPSPAADVVDTDDEEFETRPPRHRSRRRKRRSHTLAWWLIGGSVAAGALVTVGLILVLVFVVRAGMRAANAPPAPNAPHAPVEPAPEPGAHPDPGR